MWKQIKNSTFFINEKGEVKTEDRYINSHKGGTTYKRLQKGRILKGGCTLNGYEFVKLEDGKHYFRHRLVLETFKPNPDPNIYKDIIILMKTLIIIIWKILNGVPINIIATMAEEKMAIKIKQKKYINMI